MKINNTEMGCLQLQQEHLYKPALEMEHKQITISAEEVLLQLPELLAQEQQMPLVVLRIEVVICPLQKLPNPPHKTVILMQIEQLATT